MATVGFIGLGVMGEPMCANLKRKSRLPVLAHDMRNEPIQRLAECGVQGASLQDIARRADVILLSLPDGKAVQAVIDGLAPHLSAGQCVVDMSTAPVALAREIGERLAAQGIYFADAPVARTREAALRGDLSITVGATEELFARLAPLLGHMGSDVTHCGPVGTGQVVKILNNMLVFENTCAVAEAIALGRRNGVEPEKLLAGIAKGSGDSFVLRNHGMKAMVPELYPERAFSTLYAMKDLSYALLMADEAGLAVEGARLTMKRFEESVQAGNAENYHPAVRDVIDLK
ncbi:MAG: NAD(P)-dependent oxidoreductase [Acetobacteraceae bacterium]|nr:NAD(P)-dependent oxidoreductase [Acetobacteraceae bacterium]MSP29883.1 NAD(P)-dependent oxidoreductase [Acetobacteraceae bacterium]